MDMLLNMTQDEFFDRLKECFAEALRCEGQEALRVRASRTV